MLGFEGTPGVARFGWFCTVVIVPGSVLLLSIFTGTGKRLQQGAIDSKVGITSTSLVEVEVCSLRFQNLNKKTVARSSA